MKQKRRLGNTMLKKTILITALFLLCASTGCTHKPDTTGSDMDKKVSPASDFEYSENYEGSISIYNYIGTDQNIIIPKEIENKAVTRIESAFQCNHTVISVEIPDSVTTVGSSAFSGCHSLVSVSLPQGLKEIGSKAFENCARLSEISLPDSLLYIGEDAFKNCASLKHIKIPKSIIGWKSSFFNAGIETLELEDGIKIIGYYVFAYTDIKNVILPESVRKIETAAFANCTNLESISLNEGLVTVESQAFSDLPKLTEIVIPSSVSEIDESAFDGCNSLQAVKFEGNAPEKYRYKGPTHIDRGTYTVYYHKDASGFTSPWYKHPTEIW